MVFANIEGSPHIAHDRDAHDRRTEAYQLAYLRIDIAYLALALGNLNGLFQKILHYIHSALRSLGVVGSHTLLLLAGSILRHIVLTSGSSHLSLCSLVGCVSLIALLTADYALVEEVLHAVVGLLGDGCGSFSLLNQLVSALNLLLACTCIRQVLHSLGCSVGSLEHLFLRFHFRHFEDGERIAHMNVIAFLNAEFYHASRQFAGYSVF